ncbi:unnamed protein product [Cylicocyclus nassatus]|uniref:PABS domain-containing protein n=1 Tax=Cylicocyclus nassatus TaxID=53992 RepID=A0AA36M1I4_CYLNA|nr:unnamed protein product [Cylicocyclus nassatus]
MIGSGCFLLLESGISSSESLFVSDRFNLSEDCDAKILSIGLGGGTVTSFLHQIFPRMNITVVEISGQVLNAARKWFGLLEDDHQRVILTDGITFLADRAKKGASYNAILLDACLPHFASDLVCPYKSFTDEDVLKNIATLLSKQVCDGHGISLTDRPDKDGLLKINRMWLFLPSFPQPYPVRPSDH